MKIIFVSLLIFSAFCISTGLKCYTCNVLGGAADLTCLTDPESVTAGTPITDCNTNYCTSIRTEYMDPEGQLLILDRNCADLPIFINEIVENTYTRTYYKACQEDLCNGDLGTDLSEYDRNSNTGVGVLYVPGIGGGSSSNLIKPTVFVVLMVHLYLLL